MTINELAEKLLDNGWDEDIILLDNYDYADACIGISHDGRAVYDYNKMIAWLIEHEEVDNVLEAIEWIDYNTIRALPYMGEKHPIIMYKLED